jgi:hypothetical protein
MTQHLDGMDSELGSLAYAQVQLPEALAALLFRHDPIQICYQTNPDEYQPEAVHILARLSACDNAGDVSRVVYEELVRSFGTEAVGSIEEYDQMASEAWELWRKFEGGR